MHWEEYDKCPYCKEETFDKKTRICDNGNCPSNKGEVEIIRHKDALSKVWICN